MSAHPAATDPAAPVADSQPATADMPRAARPGAAGDPYVARLWHNVRSAFVGTKYAREVAELASSLQTPLTTGRRIAVVSVRGGGGKSTVAAVLASLFAARRADAVLAADADPYEGSLSWRLGLADPPTLAELAPRLVTARDADLRALNPLLPRTSGGLWVLPSGAPRQPGLCGEVTRALSRLFSVCVTDCPPGFTSPVTASVLPEAHAVVLVSAATPDAVRATYHALQRRVANGHTSSLQRVVVVLNTLLPGRRGRLDHEDAVMLDRFQVPVVTLPYDRHLAAGGLIVPSRIGEATLREATRAGGHALSRAWPI
jgi:MinD-like ATPase involved in chromosome partitioning or flagellar assembly